MVSKRRRDVSLTCSAKASDIPPSGAGDLLLLLMLAVVDGDCSSLLFLFDDDDDEDEDGVLLTMRGQVIPASEKLRKVIVSSISIRMDAPSRMCSTTTDTGLPLHLSNISSTSVDVGVQFTCRNR